LLYIAVPIASRVSLGAVLVLLCELADGVLDTLPFVSIGPFNVVTPFDGAATILLIAWGLRILTGRALLARDRLYLLTLAFAGLVALSLARGIPEYGTTAVVDARVYVYYTVGLLYFSSFEYRRIDLVAIFRMFILTGTVFAVVSIMRTIGILSILEQTHDAFEGFMALKYSAIGFGHTVTLSTILLSLLVLSLNGIVTRRLLPMLIMISIFLFAVIISQNRTLLVLFVICGLVVFYRYRLASAKVFVVTILSIFTLGTVAFFVFPEQFQKTLGIYWQSAAEPFSQQGSLKWRIYGWPQLLSQMSFTDYFIGKSMGSGYERLFQGALVVANPHNFYVRHILRLGIIGLLVFSTMKIVILRRLMRLGEFPFCPESRAIFDILLVAIVAEVTTYFGWDAMMSYSIVVGLGISLVTHVGPGGGQVRPHGVDAELTERGTHGCSRADDASCQG
jgi:O-antigen ligase